MGQEACTFLRPFPRLHKERLLGGLLIPFPVVGVKRTQLLSRFGLGAVTVKPTPDCFGTQVEKWGCSIGHMHTR